MFPDLEMVAAPVEPEARAIFIEEKRIRDQEKKAERARIKMEKKVKAETEGGAGGGGEAAAAGSKRTAAKSPSEKGTKQRKSLQQQDQQQQQQQQQQQPYVKTERPDESSSPTSITDEYSPYFNSHSNSPQPQNHYQPQQRQSQEESQYQLPTSAFLNGNNTPTPINNSHSFLNDISTPETTMMSTTPLSSTTTTTSTPWFDGTGPSSGNLIVAAASPEVTSYASPPTASTPPTTHSNESTASSSTSTSSLTQMTPSLKQEDPHLLSALQFLNQNEMLNPQQMSEQFSNYSHYFSQTSLH